VRSTVSGLNVPNPSEMTINAAGQFSARTRFEHGLINEPRRSDCQPRVPTPSLFCRSTQVGWPSRMRVDRIEIAFQGRLVQPAELDRDIVKSSGSEPAVEVP